MSSAKATQNLGDSSMHINTRFGAQDIDPATIITFPNGLAGFEELHDFTLFHEQGKPTVFYLQSVEQPDVQFPVVNPDAYQVSYECVLNDDEAAVLQIEDPSEVAVLVTLAQTGDQDRGIHANFMGPILLNTGKRVGLQKHLNQVSGSVVIRAE